MEDLTANTAKYDGQTVILRGTATAVKATTFRKGNDYTAFHAKDGLGSAVKVFSWGHPGIKGGFSQGILGVQAYQSEGPLHLLQRSGDPNRPAPWEAGNHVSASTGGMWCFAVAPFEA